MLIPIGMRMNTKTAAAKSKYKNILIQALPTISESGSDVEHAQLLEQTRRAAEMERERSIQLMVGRACIRIFLYLLFAAAVLVFILIPMGMSIWACYDGLIVLATSKYRGQYEAVHQWVVGVDPQPPSLAEDVASKLQSMYARFDTTLAMTLIVGIITLLSIWLFAGFAYYSVRKVVFRAQGIQFEAMRPGSTFVAGPVPRYQVRILKPGMIMHDHIGYGLRIGQNYMVAPTHVIAGLGEILLEGPKGRIVIVPGCTQSRVHSDVTYVHLEERQWTTLGVAVGKLAPTANAFVKCHGVAGFSSGRLSKSMLEGMLTYEGSTEPGMSGAAYDYSGAILGMHTGVIGSGNSGVSAALLRYEYARMMRPEAKKVRKEKDQHSADTGDNHAWFLGQDVGEKVNKWNEEMLASRVDDVYSGSWANDVAIDFNAQLDFSESTRPQKRSGLQVSFNPEGNVILQKDQNDEGSETVYTVTDVNLEARVRDLERRVKELETGKTKSAVSFPCGQCDVKCRTEAALSKHVENSHREKESFPCDKCDVVCGTAQALANHKGSHVVKFKCDHCDVECRSEKALKNHVTNSHTVVTGESASPSDFRVEVKTSDFLGNRSRSVPRNARKSSTTSRSSRGSSPSLSMVAVLSQMTKSLENIERRLNEERKVTAGPSSATSPK
uniref:C2H2-type domain-containing protein n=1 Tax=Riboviria sp. TaxID=2585031 RepID=A0A8K1WSJ9_9VIRU|nr:MAG: hypothetical protein 2 [Riboviria sp.]